jgi:ubiquinone/menaquinone biosynthesis C-methylase UbiE
MAELGPTGASPENAFAASLFEPLPRRYDRLAEVLSLGQNKRWREALVVHLARFQPQRILDVATGTAGVAIALAHATHAHVVGVDISEPMLERGRQRVQEAELDARIRLEVARAEELPFPDGAFDAVSFTYLLRYVADPAATLAELARVVRPGGGMAGLDFFVHPIRCTASPGVPTRAWCCRLPDTCLAANPGGRWAVSSDRASTASIANGLWTKSSKPGGWPEWSTWNTKS